MNERAASQEQGCGFNVVSAMPSSFSPCPLWPSCQESERDREAGGDGGERERRGEGEKERERKKEMSVRSQQTTIPK